MTSAKAMITAKVEDALARLEILLKADAHLDAGDGLAAVKGLVDSLSVYWSIMDDEQRDFVQGAQHMVETNSRWVV